ncbi:hypothetical protein GCK32_002983 [Trichostrongylus colubriformis]|uniref:Uncharacterized protein n=1 Tax=Trichostrongylus colubriformis TaxID=6319 RepID=A0AAN8F7R6_TRICO
MEAENGKEEREVDKEDKQDNMDELIETEDVIAEALNAVAEAKERNEIEQKEEQQVENDDEEMFSIASSDLSMADEACENSDDDEELEQSDEVVECDSYDPVEDFDPESLKPSRTKHIREPWYKHPPAECDAKNWEIFVEAVEAFDRDTIFEGIDDFIVTIETLLPHLPSCFVTLVKDSTITEKEAASRIMVWIEVCLSKEVQALEEVKKMHDIAFGILKSVAEAPKNSVVGKHLVESGVMELLLSVLEETECADLRMRSLNSIFQLISLPTLWRVTNLRFRQGNPESQPRTPYSRLVAISLEHRYFIGKNFLQLLALIMSWSRFATTLTELELAAKKLMDAVYHISNVEDLPVTEFTEKWDTFIFSFNALREYILQFDDEKVCASFDVYSILQSSELLSICVRLLTMSRVSDRFPNVLRFIHSLLNDKYYGTFLIVNHAELVPLLRELKLLADIENGSRIEVSEDFFEEGVCELDEKFPSATEMRLTIAYRLRALHLLDELRSCSATVRHNIDDDARISALMSLYELCNDTSGRGQREVVWILAQKYVYYIMDIIEYASAHSSLRSCSSFMLSLNLLEVVVANVDDARFWLRNAKSLSRLVSAKGGITSTMHKKLYEYLTPFTDPLLHNLGTGGPDVVGCIIKEMKSAFERRAQLTPPFSTSVRVLEAVLVNASNTSRLEIFHMMEQDGSLDSLAQWLFELVQNRHAMWQMGEPASSEASKRFRIFAFPVLRIFASYMRSCNDLVGSVIKGAIIRSKEDAEDINHRSERTVELRTLSDVMMDALFLMWSLAGGMNGQKYTPECQKIRLAVLDVLSPTLFYEKSLAAVIRHVLFRSCSRPHLFAAALSLLMNLAPWTPPLVIAKNEVPSWKDVVIGHRQRVNRFVHAFFSCENRHEIAEILLSPSPYISELSLKFIDRMSSLDRRLAQDLAGISMNYIIAAFKVRQNGKSKEKAMTPAGSVNGDDVTKENEEHRPASTGMVRLMESLVRLCSAKYFRIVLHEFLSHYPSRAKFLMPILTQFEKPTYESERQSRFQNAVLELISGLCCPSLWSAEADLEFSDCEGCPPIHSIEDSPPEGFFVGSNKKEEKQEKRSRPPSVTIIEDDADDTATALELVEDSDSDRKCTSSLEAVISSFCTFVINPDQKIAVVRRVLEVLSKATSAAVEQQNKPFIEVLRGCIQRTGVRPLFDRIDKSFNSEDVEACLLPVASTLDSLVGEQVDVLCKMLDYSQSEHPMASLIIKIEELSEPSVSLKCSLKILDKFFESLSNYLIPDEALNDAEDIKIPVMYGRSADVDKAYRTPVVEVVSGAQEVYERVKAASRILVKRQKTVGTRMGSEVAKIIDTNGGKEKAVRKLLRKELGLREPVEPPTPRDSPRKRPPPASKESRDVKQKRV